MVQSLTVGLLPEGFSRVRKKTIGLLVVAFIVAAGVILFAVSDSIAEMWWIVPVVLCIPVYGVGSAYVKLLRRQQQEWESYRLALDNEHIVREISNNPTLSIQRSEITGVEEMPTGAIIVKTQDKDWFIYIPPEIERRDEVRRLLSLVTPAIEPHKPSFAVRYRVPLLLVWIGMLITFFVSISPFIEIPFGVFILGFLIYARIQTRKNRMLSKNNEVKLWFIIVFAVIVLVKILASLGVLIGQAQ